MNTRSIYRGVWRKKRLHIQEWMAPCTLLTRTETASLLGTSKDTLARMAKRGEGPLCDSETYSGNGVWYRVVDCLTWWFEAIGTPKSMREISKWWLEKSHNWFDEGKNPRKRGNRPRGMSRRAWSKKQRSAMELIFWEAQYKLTLMSINYQQFEKSL